MEGGGVQCNDVDGGGGEGAGGIGKGGGGGGEGGKCTVARGCIGTGVGGKAGNRLGALDSQGRKDERLEKIELQNPTEAAGTSTRAGEGTGHGHISVEDAVETCMQCMGGRRDREGWAKPTDIG